MHWWKIKFPNLEYVRSSDEDFVAAVLQEDTLASFLYIIFLDYSILFYLFFVPPPDKYSTRSFLKLVRTQGRSPPVSGKIQKYLRPRRHFPNGGAPDTRKQNSKPIFLVVHNLPRLYTKKEKKTTSKRYTSETIMDVDYAVDRSLLANTPA